MRIGVNYNERSWAIDLIGHIKMLVLSQNRAIQDAGGEQTIRTDSCSLFPDVLLFGDRSLALILQGWELKMPDTSIDDYEFRYNAIQKANTLGLDSFLLWNVSNAHLYVKDHATKTYICTKKWNTLSHIKSRKSVVPNRKQWEELATEIINYMNDLFDRGTLEGRQFVEAYKSGGVTALIMENTDDVTMALQKAAMNDGKLRAEIDLWSERYKSEYKNEENPYKKLAQANISNWIGKLLFAHILQARDKRAQAINQIGDTTTPTDALRAFERLSQDCNFWTIFSNSIGLAILPERAWDQIKQFNKLLTDLRISSIEQNQLSAILEATVEVAVRKLRGQYPTPPTLAGLLVRLCVNDIENDKILDPCCGSGSIPRAALEQKLAAGVLPEKAAASVFASDQDHQAIQIATFAMAKPDLMNIPLRLFQYDAFSLKPNTKLNFRNPATGLLFSEDAGQFNVINSNLPFVGQEGRIQYGNAIASVFNKKSDNLPKNADVAAYLPFALYDLLAERGKLGIIITNAWLATAWGEVFFDLLNSYYHLRSIITSGAGRWFQNSKVVTNILVMEKKNFADEPDKLIDFVVLTRPLEELSDATTLQLTASQILLGRTHNETMTIRSVTRENIKKFRTYGLGGNAQFVDCDWVLDLPLVPVKSLFQIRRGERRGWDKLFYPSRGHNIEPQYISTVLLNPKEINHYNTTAKSEVFNCSRSLVELQDANHTGALNWIRRFEHAVNTKGKPLTESLARKKIHWYEMGSDKLADLVMPLNFGNRLFVSRLVPAAFVNQRLICLNAYENTDIELCHALLNSAISLFIIEGMGFGRGQGVLDLNKDRIEKFMHILDPNQLNEKQIAMIKSAFASIIKRDLLEIADELEENDRKDFDRIIVEVFRLNISIDQVYESLLRLVAIRQTANDNFLNEITIL